MLRFKKPCIILHSLFLILSLLLTTSISQNASATICDELNSYTLLSPVNQMIICKSQKPYHRCETLNISHSSCSSSLNSASPKLLSASLTSQSNLLLLYNCSNSNLPSSPLSPTLTCLHTSGASTKIQKPQGISSTACLLVADLTKFYMDFNHSDFNCSCYGIVYEKPSSHENYEELGLGTRTVLEVPDHIPNICDECQKTNGNCGAALRCICHPKECKNKVISNDGSTTSFGCNILVFVLFVLVVSTVNS